ncbi:hypothetical protein [Actinomycetospora sp. CA-084318]|uniref:hypothetical protein n=1 Tax=Actinomycetospora sp. CA-084318 TaxID=3239892 RepID=UPI003D966D6D
MTAIGVVLLVAAAAIPALTRAARILRLVQRTAREDRMAGLRGDLDLPVPRTAADESRPTAITISRDGSEAS